MTVKRKLTLGCAAAALSLLALGYGYRKTVRSLGDLLDSAADRSARRMELVGEVREIFQDLKHDSMRDQIAYALAQIERGARGQPADGTSCSACHTPRPREDRIRDLEVAGRTARSRTQHLRALMTDPVGVKALEAVDKQLTLWLQRNREYLDLASAGKFDEAHTVLRDGLMPVAQEVEEVARVLSRREREALDDSKAAANQAIRFGLWRVGLLIVVCLLVVGGVLWTAFRVVAGLRGAVMEMSDVVVEMGVTAGDVSAAAKSLALGASQQAASIEETSASSEQIDSMARKNSDTLGAVTSLVADSQEQFADANRSLQEMVTAMEEITQQSDRIAQIIKVIDEIAFQTDILALNAAVEAARAGEAGQGFAVVADEVRSLAQRSAQAASDTSRLIRESIRKANDGKAKVDKLGAAIKSVTGASTRVGTLVEEVSQGSREQSTGVAQIAQAIGRIDHLTQATAAHAEKSASACEALTEQARSIHVAVLRLATLVSGDNDHGVSEQVQLALAAHTAWKDRLAHAIETGASEIPVEKARLDDQCVFGRWLNGEDIKPADKATPQFRKIVELHRRFHEAAGGVLSEAISGNKDSALRGVAPGSEFAEVSEDLANELRRWHHAAVGG